jgi:hypothetical protein
VSNKIPDKDLVIAALESIADAVECQIRRVQDLNNDGVRFSEQEVRGLISARELADQLRVHARVLSKETDMLSIVDELCPIKSIAEAGVEQESYGWTVGSSGVTKIVPYIDRGEAWLAVYQNDHICARVPAKAMIITYKQPKNVDA